MNVFEYAAIEEKNFELQASESGYKRISTFYSDLSIAECFGVESIKETFDNVCQSWLSSYKMFTEFIISLNWKSWKWYEQNNNAISKLYAELYHKAVQIFLDKYGEDRDAIKYYYEVTD